MCTELKYISGAGHTGCVMVMEDVSSLQCYHEEVDTSLLLLAAHAADSGYRTVIIQSPNTDMPF